MNVWMLFLHLLMCISNFMLPGPQPLMMLTFTYLTWPLKSIWFWCLKTDAFFLEIFFEKSCNCNSILNHVEVFTQGSQKFAKYMYFKGWPLTSSIALPAVFTLPLQKLFVFITNIKGKIFHISMCIFTSVPLKLVTRLRRLIIFPKILYF